MKTNRKYIVASGIAAAVLAVGGTAAFFTSSDSILNPFETGLTDEDHENAGIDVQEDFRTLALGIAESEEFPSGLAAESYLLDGVTYVNTNPSRGFEEYDDNSDTDIYGELVSGPTKMLPGELFIKAMRVESEVNYDQYLRIDINVKVGEDVYELDDLPEGLLVETDLTGWRADGEFLYYENVFAAGAVTDDLVESVVILAEAGNEWQDKEITVELKAESIQATTDAWTSEWLQILDDLPTE